MDTVRIGVLGAARIAPAAVIRPARETAEAEVVAIRHGTAPGRQVRGEARGAAGVR